jgi:predicted transcriptional regulator
MTQGRKPKRDDDVLLALHHQGALSSKDICLYTGIHPTYIHKVISRLLRKKRIAKEGKKYKFIPWETVAVASSNTSVKSIKTPKAVEKSNPTIDALKDELDYIRTTVNQLVQTGEYLKTRIQELST